MSYCPKCGNKVDDSMTFCPRCGASLKIETSATKPGPSQQYPTYRNEKQEKHEKGGNEKGEKHEKGEFGYIGWLIGGVLIIILGLTGYAEATGIITGNMESALVLLAIGISVIIIAIWLSSTARRRHPMPPA
ncbi:MAG TPA: zinc ribbon domain-containing protein [Candidatus Nanoarchaeia archaeon]|nr:zinc ribbon domain-containing protein [Candidatus Nanoarchaeia archaeon]